MDNIELFRKIKDKFEDLKFEEDDKSDGLYKRLTMLIKNIHGKNSEYLEDLLIIQCSPITMDGRKNVIHWKSAKNSTINLIDTVIEELVLFPSNTSKSNQTNKETDLSKVFIVHGHDNGAKNEVARFIEKLGFEAIIIHEQSSSGDTIIDKIIRYSYVGFGVVLYTECDVGAVKSQPENLRSRARQNVVFEHGFLIGKIGRENVVALVKGNIEKPNDISGVVYVSLDESDGWKLSLAREMIASGYDVDMSKFL